MGKRLVKTRLLLLMFLAIMQSGCARFGGAETGALATGSAYEIHVKRQMNRLQDDLKNRRISADEYEDRKQQIQKGSIIY